MFPSSIVAFIFTKIPFSRLHLRINPHNQILSWMKTDWTSQEAFDIVVVVVVVLAVDDNWIAVLSENT